MNIVYPNHLKIFKETKSELKRDNGLKPRRKTRNNYKHK